MEMISLAILGVLIVISPGADFVLVLKTSINDGRKAGMFTALGLSLAICVHISYSMFGISYLISQNEFLYNMIRYAGAGYLLYLGIKGIYSSNSPLNTTSAEPRKNKNWQYLAQGFLCNVLNPKTMLFFLSVFSQVISSDSNDNTYAFIYGVYMIALHGLWFAIVAILFTSKALQTRLLRVRKRLNQVCGIGLVSFGALLALKS